MGGPCHDCNKVCEDTFAKCVEESLSFDEIREEYDREYRHGVSPRQRNEEYSDELSREDEWRYRPGRLV